MNKPCCLMMSYMGWNACKFCTQRYLGEKTHNSFLYMCYMRKVLAASGLSVQKSIEEGDDSWIGKEISDFEALFMEPIPWQQIAG